MRKIYLIYVLIGLASIGLAHFLYLLQPADSDIAAKNFLIERGQNFKEIAQALKKAGLIRSELGFKIYSLLSFSAHRLKAGNYFLSPSFSTPRITASLVLGPEVDVKAVIIEGKELAEIDKTLSALGIFKNGELINFSWQGLSDEFTFLKKAKSLEGFLFPDTYRFYPNSQVESAARKFLENFQKKALPVLSRNQSSLTNYQLLILASLIEKEVPFSEDRLLVSGILHKRLQISMPLQVDAAPDTYKYYGLPAKPIANPGLDAIYAAGHPKASDYLYYLSDPKTKKTIFSKTLEEHNENRAKYLKK